MYELFSINNIFFTVLGYPMSYIEFFGTIFNLWCVYLVVKNNIWNWPIGIVGVILFGFMFYQINLYSDLFEQIYFFITSFYGWWAWIHMRNTNQANAQELSISRNNQKNNLIYFIIIILGTILLGYFTSNIHIYFAEYFPEPASFPYLDAFTTILSFAATILMAHRKIECWYLWILVDVIGVWLYFAKDVRLVSILYFIFLILATRGLISWSKIYKHEQQKI